MNAGARIVIADDDMLLRDAVASLLRGGGYQVLLEDVFAVCRRELMSHAGEPARAYLATRGIPADRVADSGLGLFPTPDRLLLALASLGHATDDVRATHLDAD